MKCLSFFLLFSVPVFAANLFDHTSQIGIALPVQGEIAVWDLSANPPEALAQHFSGELIAGQCYTVSSNKLSLQPENPSCLDYYVYDLVPEDLEPVSASGQIAFNHVTPDIAFRGLELRDVEGVDQCGERENCDVLYIAGFANLELVATAMQAARNGQTVHLQGRKVWNSESMDLLVESIRVTP